jgi:hypothetical protein
MKNEVVWNNSFFEATDLTVNLTETLLSRHPRFLQWFQAWSAKLRKSFSKQIGQLTLLQVFTVVCIAESE